MDRERADFQKTVDEIKESLAFNPVIIQLPIGAEENFKGYVDIITGKAFLFDGDKGGVKPTDIPAELADEVASLRETLMENVAETDDELIEKFLEEGELTEEELLAGLKTAIATGELAPICVCSATLNKGTGPLLDIINDLMPCPSDRQPISGHKSWQ